MNIMKYFDLWRNTVKRFKEYDQWCCENNENPLPIDNCYWEWNYNDCDHDI